jgi:hypothetical protein
MEQTRVLLQGILPTPRTQKERPLRGGSMETVQREAFCPQGSQTEPCFTYVPTKRRRGDGTNSLKHLVSQNTKTPVRDSLEKYPRKQLARS